MDNRYPPDRNNRRTVASWPLIITCFIIVPLFPLGLILMLVRLNDRNRNKSSEYRHRYNRDSGYTSGHIYNDEHDRPPRYMRERKKTGKASFIVSLVFFFVGGITIIDALENFFYWGGLGSGVLQQLYVGMCFVVVGLYLVWPHRLMGRYYKGKASFIVSMSLFFVGGIIITRTLEENLFYGIYYGIGASLFVGLCFIFAGFLVIRPKNNEGTRNGLYERYANIVGDRKSVV